MISRIPRLCKFFFQSIFSCSDWVNSIDLSSIHRFCLLHIITGPTQEVFYFCYCTFHFCNLHLAFSTWGFLFFSGDLVEHFYSGCFKIFSGRVSAFGQSWFWHWLSFLFQVMIFLIFGMANYFELYSEHFRYYVRGFLILFNELLRWLSGKETTCNPGATGNEGSIPGLGRSPGGGHGNPLWCSCLGYPTDRGAWQATVHELTKSWSWLKQLSTHSHSYLNIPL